MLLDLQQYTELNRLLADPTRIRLLSLVEREELSVAELTAITHLAQSRISSHLGRLREAGMVRDRREGASTFYSLNASQMSPAAKRSWELLRAQLCDPLLEQDAERIAEVVQARAGGSTWADSVAGSMERHYSPGRTWEAVARGFLGLSRLGEVLDVASGDGVLAELIATRARSITCLDLSGRVVRAGRRRLQHLPGVRFLQGDMHHLPFATRSFDHAVLMNALVYSPDPEAVFGEVQRVLRPMASLVVVTLRSHAHQAAVQPFDHRNLGQEPAALREMLEKQGLVVEMCEVTSREKRAPHFEVITVYAHRIEE